MLYDNGKSGGHIAEGAYVAKTKTKILAIHVIDFLKVMDNEKLAKLVEMHPVLYHSDIY